jgi:(S)-citramalyl-CoA lyase
VIIDLEDGVHQHAKEKARNVLALLDLNQIARKNLTFGVRINCLQSVNGIRDLDVIYAGCEKGTLKISFIQIPKVKSHHDMIFCRSILASLPIQLRLIPTIEVPEAVDYVDQIATHSDAMMFGQVDMAAAMYQENEAYLAYARGRFCVACARAGISAIDTAAINREFNVTDTRIFEEKCIASKAEGFTAKAVIHPVQVPIVNKIYAISEQEITQYRSVIQHYEQTKEGFSLVNGMVIAPPFVVKAHMMLRLYQHEPFRSSSYSIVENSR